MSQFIKLLAWFVGGYITGWVLVILYFALFGGHP